MFESIDVLLVAAPLTFALILYSHFRFHGRIMVRIFRLENPMLKVVKRAERGGRRSLTLILKLLLAATLCMGLASPYVEVERLETREVEAEIREVLNLARPAVVVVVDVSGSMSEEILGGAKITVAKSVIMRFLDGLPANISVGLIAFDNAIRRVVPIVRDKERVKSSVDELVPSGGTMFTYPLTVALNMLKPYRIFNASCTVVFISDGLPADRGLYDSLLREMGELNITVNTVYIGPGGDEGALEMRRIAEVTGGRWFSAETAEELAEVFESLSREITSMTAGYVARISTTESVIEKINLSWCFLSASAVLLLLLLCARHRALGLSF